MKMIEKESRMICAYCRRWIRPGDWYITNGVERAHLKCDLDGGGTILRGVGVARQGENKKRTMG